MAAALGTLSDVDELLKRPDEHPPTVADGGVRSDRPGAANAAANDDARLVAAAGRGDHGAFETIYFQYRDWVVALAWRFTGDRETALDVMQETFAYLVRRLPTLTLTARLTTFLYPVVRSLATDLCRKRRLGAPRPGEAAAVTADASEFEALRNAVGALPETQREVVLMRYVSDMSLEEIAIALGIPLGTVKSRLHAATRALANIAPK